MSGTDHLRGKDDRTAEDAGHGNPRPDEVGAGEPPAIQATHAGMPVDAPLVERMEDTGAGRESAPMGDTGGPESGYRRLNKGQLTEGAFGEEEGLPDRDTFSGKTS